MEKEREVFLSYVDENNLVVNAWFKLIEQTQTYVKVKSGSNLLIIPMHKINKIKERLENGYS